MAQYKLKETTLPLDGNWDVIVAGGGPAGCAAAAAAAREGAKTLLIEATGALGGMGTLGLVPWFCGYDDGKKIIARGIAGQIRRACRDHMPHLKKAMALNPLSDPAIDPELLKRVYDDLLVKSGAAVLFNTRLASVCMASASAVDAIIVSNKKGLSALRAAIYVDCTGDGDLAAWSGASYEKGDEKGRLQPATHCFMIASVDEKALANGPEIHYRDPRSPIHKAIRSKKYPDIIELHSCSIKIGPGAFGFNTGHVYDVDNTDPANVSKALMLGRRLAGQYRDAFAEFHPRAFGNSFLAATGSLLGARETRRIAGDYRLTVEDYLARRSFPDEICRNAYGVDVHHSSREEVLAQEKKSIAELRKEVQASFQHLKPGESFGVPYRCLAPKDLVNVLVAGRCISAGRLVYGSIRIMACCLNTGEAAGAAAAMAAAGSRDVHKVDTNALRAKLKRHGAHLPGHKKTQDKQ